MAAFLSLSHSSALFLMFRLWIRLIMLFLWMRCKMTLLRQTLWCRARSDPGSKSMPDHLLKPDFLIAPGQRAFIFFQLCQVQEPPYTVRCLTATVKTLTLTIDSLVWAMSEMTPSVMMRSTKYCEPSFTEAAYLHTKTHKTIFVVISVSAALFRLLPWFITRASFWVVLNCLSPSQIKYAKIAVWKRTKGGWWKEHESEKRSKIYGKVTLQAKWK